MSKGKAVLLVVLAVVLAAVIAVGVVGCSSKSQPAGSSNSSVTTNNGQASGQPSGQSSQPGGSQRQFNPQQMQNNIKQALAGLVSNGTITQAQADQVTQAYAQAFANRPQGSGQQGSYPQGSGQQGSGQQGSGHRQNPILTQLVSKGTITQDQANAINQAIMQAMPHHPRTGSSGSGQTTTE